MVRCEVKRNSRMSMSALNSTRTTLEDIIKMNCQTLLNSNAIGYSTVDN